MKKVFCDFAKTGKGCQKTHGMYSWNMERHKEFDIVVHVDLLNENLNTQWETSKHLQGTIDSQKLEIQSLQNFVAELPHAIQGMKKQFAVILSLFLSSLGLYTPLP